MTTHTQRAEKIKDDKVFCSVMALDISVHEVVFYKHICGLFVFFFLIKGCFTLKNSSVK